MTEDNVVNASMPPSRVHVLMRLSRPELITMWLGQRSAVSNTVREAVTSGASKEAIVAAIVQTEEDEARRKQRKGSK
jgi:hypothetical protein